MCYAGSKLTEGTEFVGAGGPFAFLLLLGDIVSDAKDTGHLAIDDNRGGVHERVTNRTVACHVSRFESLRLATQTGHETRASHVSVCVVNVLEEMAADQGSHFVARQVEHRLVAPFIHALAIDCVNRLAGTLEDVFNEGLMFARHSFDFS